MDMLVVYVSITVVKVLVVDVDIKLANEPVVSNTVELGFVDVITRSLMHKAGSFLLPFSQDKIPNGLFFVITFGFQARILPTGHFLELKLLKLEKLIVLLSRLPVHRPSGINTIKLYLP